MKPTLIGDVQRVTEDMFNCLDGVQFNIAGPAVMSVLVELIVNSGPRSKAEDLAMLKDLYHAMRTAIHAEHAELEPRRAGAPVH